MMKSTGMMHALLALSALSEGTRSQRSPVPTKEDIEKSKFEAEQKHKANLLKKGLKEFYIDGHVVYARDLKNAKRKAKNLSNGN